MMIYSGVPALLENNQGYLVSFKALNFYEARLQIHLSPPNVPATSLCNLTHALALGKLAAVQLPLQPCTASLCVLSAAE